MKLIILSFLSRFPILKATEKANSSQGLYTNLLGACVVASLCLALDLFLFFAGKSWTPIQYESFLPLLLYGQGRFDLTKNCIALFLLLASKILYYEFGLTVHLIFESLPAMVLFIASSFALLSLMTIDIAKRPWILAPGLIVITFGYFFDKNFENDKLLSSYVLNQFEIGKVVTPSKNGIYEELLAHSKTSNGAILIVWESLGWPLDNDSFVPLFRSNPEIKIRRIQHEGGSTTTAESRYLCGTNNGVKDYAACLPHKIASVAYHGNLLSYFRRNFIYPAFGFQRSFGKRELASLPICKFAYDAICDANLIDRMIDDVGHDGCAGLHYMLTIDSHFPYGKYKDHVAGLVDDVGQAVRKLSVVARKFPNCKISILGDHPPPLATGFDAHAITRIDIN